jgi:hypothetical protein
VSTLLPFIISVLSVLCDRPPSFAAIPSKSAGNVLQGSYSSQERHYDGNVLELAIQEGGAQVMLFP